MDIPHANRARRPNYRGASQRPTSQRHSVNHNNRNVSPEQDNSTFWKIMWMLYGVAGAVWGILWAFETAPILTVIGVLTAGYFFIKD